VSTARTVPDGKQQGALERARRCPVLAYDLFNQFPRRRLGQRLLWGDDDDREPRAIRYLPALVGKYTRSTPAGPARKTISTASRMRSPMAFGCTLARRSVRSLFRFGLRLNR